MLLLLACVDDAPVTEPTVTPAEASAFGDVDVTIDLAGTGLRPADVTAVDLGDTATVDLRVDGDTLIVRAQGSPTPGSVDLGLWVDGARQSWPDRFTWAPAPDPALERFVVVGASISMGIQSAGVGESSMRQSPAADVARQLGVYLGPPLWADTLFPRMTVAEVGPAPDCTLPAYEDHVLGVITTAIAAMQDPEGDVVPGLVRLDPALRVNNLAVAGTTVAEVVHGYADDEMPEQIFAKAMWAPDLALFDPLPTTPLEEALARDPTAILILDLFGNDLVDALTDGPIDPALAMDAEALRPDVAELFDQLTASGAHVWMANTPRLSPLGIAEEARRASIAGGATEAEAQALLDEVDDKALAMNTMLDEVVAGRDDVTIIDLAAEVDAIADGLDVGGVTLRTGRFGGLIGLDGLHFTATGNAVLANVALASIARDLGLDVEPVDLEAVMADDPDVPAALEAAGLDLGACR